MEEVKLLKMENTNHFKGWIAMSPFSHECYLRKWAAKTRMPIISINYRKAPEHKFPIAVEECFQVYKWILMNGEKILGQPVKKIFIGGDSAGGNLTLITTLRVKIDQ